MSGVKRRQGRGVRCRPERSFTEEIMEPLDSNVSVSGAVGKREMMQRIAVSVLSHVCEVSEQSNVRIIDVVIGP